MSVLNREYQGQNCSIAHALELVGERWTLLIIRDAFLGLRRFDEFQESLGISRNVLTDRLNRLVEEGIFEAIPYGIRQDRYDYQLTRMGRDLHVALVGLRQWGDKYLCDKPPTLARRKRDRRPLVAALVPRGTVTVPIGEAEFVAGPGRDPNAPTWRVLARRPNAT
jgi:DNA-binding HxlR family transcriptional regulator